MEKVPEQGLIDIANHVAKYGIKGFVLLLRNSMSDFSGTFPRVTCIPEILPFPTHLTEHITQLNNVGYFDCEWNQNGLIYCFCYIDALNGVTKLHVKDYPDRHSFMSAVTHEKFVIVWLLRLH